MFFNSKKRNALRSRLTTLVGATAIALTIAAVSIPNLMRSRIAANEASAVGSMRTLNTALVTYNNEHPGEGYPQTLSDLAPYVDASLAAGQKAGYNFRYVPQSRDWDGAVKRFRVEAVPVTAQSGVRRFSADEGGEIRYRASLAKPEQLLESGSSQSNAAPTAPRTIRTASLNLVVAEPLAVGEKIRLLAHQFGGYVESVRSENEGADGIQTSIKIRIPVDHFEEARQGVRKLGARVTHEQDDARDVAAQHVDLESHLRNYRSEEIQYLGVMRRSGTIKDTLAVAERLADVRGRIERTQGQLDGLEHQSEMALLEVCLRTEVMAHAVEGRWYPRAEIRAAFWNAADDLSTYANFMIKVFFRLPIFVLWTITIVASFSGGWRLLRWTWRRLAPSSTA